MKSLFPELIKKSVRYKLGQFGSLRFRNPGKDLTIIGVTGTSGKSTTTSMIFHMLKELGHPVGMIGTTGARVNDKTIDTGLHVTTPDHYQLQRLFREMVDEGAQIVVLEVSSHALDQRRIGPVVFDFAVFTNIKRDHLDWHGSWEAYAKAKATLLTLLKPKGIGVVNRDDDSYVFLKQFAKEYRIEDKVISYSKRELQDLVIEPDHIAFIFNTVTFSIPIIGGYNLENILATVTLGQTMQLETEDIAQAISTYNGLKGRMEVMNAEPFYAIVDFAHNADSLEKSLSNAKQLTKHGGKVIAVFGSAGKRDIEKRYTMGEVSGKIADVTIITAEDPRTEALEAINTEIIEGAKQGGAKLVGRFATHDEYEQFISSTTNFDIEPKIIYAFDENTVDSRFDAIDFAVQIAEPGDVVITEGKGHELSLAFGQTEYPFTDQEAMERAFKHKFENANQQEKKVIKFTPELTEKIKEGVKTRTFRLFDDKNLQKGDEVIFATRDGQHVSNFGEGRLNNVYAKKLKDLNNDDYEGHEEVSDPVETYRKYYGDKVTEDTEVKIVDFEVEKLYE